MILATAGRPGTLSSLIGGLAIIGVFYLMLRWLK